jgi:hypothetical protein
VGDINVLNPLQTLVLACGQVRFYDPVDAGGIRPRGSSYEPISVGTVLLAVRYGKRRPHELDNLSHRQADTEVGLT